VRAETKRRGLTKEERGKRKKKEKEKEGGGGRENE